jgi:enterochelin esterase-like enzyme
MIDSDNFVNYSTAFESSRRTPMKSLLSAVVLLASVLLLPAQNLPSVASGKIVRVENFPSAFVAARNVDVWLPEGYSPEKKYAVVYMHDGQMLFDTATTWNKQEWGVDETLGNLMAAKKIRDCIVVGVWNSKTRHSDYFPQKPFELLTKAEQDTVMHGQRSNNQALFSVRIQSDNYLKFLVTELKPFIDSAYSTLKDQSNTFIAGSSMGGLISMYAICEYPAVFGGAACLSTHWPGVFMSKGNPVPAAFMRYLKEHLPSPNNHSLYFDYGTKTLDSLYKPFQKQADAIMNVKGYTSRGNAANWMTREFAGANHSEASWQERLAIPVQFLLRNREEKRSE